ncbi:hypothetical protein [Nonomuraea dietziae]|uniref:Protein-L-isoaspartate(D-aspartate) O-methyltransferase n=1 Tax=Nonomuraea dietziae TaxID=65515 RepID=A0A7W5Y623_9ACTN|nr:hypothetical protein [Nonomuraea dietziae]MBB3725643.1 protein-L-isoaspartate(D-aspartate) O-methyltransferase [Nonomuraea dietziae]
MISHGPGASTHLGGLLHEWDRARPSLPTITAYPARTPDEALSAGYLIDRPGARLIVTW